MLKSRPKSRKSKPQRSPQCLCCDPSSSSDHYAGGKRPKIECDTGERKKVKFGSSDLYESEDEVSSTDDVSLAPAEPQLNRLNPGYSKNLELTVRKMWKEMEKDNPDLDLLKNSMKMTFPYRKYEYENNSEVFAMFNAFPVLRDFRFLKGDLKLLLKVRWASLDDKLEECLPSQYTKFMMDHDLKPDPVIASAKEQLHLQRWNEELLRDIQLLCLGFNKSRGKLYNSLYMQRDKNEEPFKSPNHTPTIDIKGPLGCDDTRITVYCEGQRITTTPNFYEAVMCSYALHWLFNIVYDKDSKRFFEFFDRLIGD